MTCKHAELVNQTDILFDLWISKAYKHHGKACYIKDTCVRNV